MLVFTKTTLASWIPHFLKLTYSSTLGGWEGWGGFLFAQMVKNLPATQETWIRSLGQEDSLKKGMATHSSIPV